MLIEIIAYSGGIIFALILVIVSFLILFKFNPSFFFPFTVRSLLEEMSILKKISWRTYFETNLRAETGKPLDRPYGTIRAVFNWNKLIFNPVYLTKNPLSSEITVNTETILGPKAAKPLKLKIPIIIAGMAYGSGYSLDAKIALAKAATMSGTATNSGNGPFLEEERRFADNYIVQYPRGFWSKDETVFRQADMIEIALGHSARGSAPVRVKGNKITEEVAKRYGTIPGLDVLMESRLPEVETAEDWKNLIAFLKEISGGVPISVKFGATHFLEEEIRFFIDGGIDVLVFDGLEGGTHGGMPVLMDDTGLPLLPSLCRAARYLREHNLQDQVSLVVGGGLINPGDFAKCLALGADAVIIGTITALVQSHTQVTKTLPWEPPTGLLYNDGKEKNKYDSDLGAKHMHYFLQSCVKEMQLMTGTLGKTSLKELERSDLVALDPLYAQIADIDYLGNRH